jgi:2-pyrone-4,6-dicarboxylate lactonase
MPSWDCHVHVFTARARLADEVAYVPAPAEVEALAAHLAAHEIDRAVIVQPSPYATDNSCLYAALEALGPMHRAVVAVEPDAGRSELVALRDKGVRGLRFNPLGRIGEANGTTRDAVAMLGRAAAGAGLALELSLEPAALIALGPLLAANPATIVLPHFAGLLDAGCNARLVEVLAGLVETGRVWIKASGVDRTPEAGRDARLAAAAAFLRAHRPDRVVWGSDWPHTPLHNGHPATVRTPQPHRSIDVAAARTTIAEAFGADLWRAATVANPEALYQ